MAADPKMRASDDDRDRVASALREHYAQGRLTVEEFDERLEQLYASKTYGELAVLTSDLPGVDLRKLPEPAARTPKRREGEDLSPLAAMWAPWAIAGGVNWVIWFIIGAANDLDFPYPWPLWVMGPWGALLLVGTVIMKLSKDGKP
ncbi:DUF1707 SHOCT-like domain-containing protein [Planomonospora venezuelensis]|uniref:DUF1707 domain-containing protein n=1 Tax=Planomonospora venezuelensis TaxID=1999 RepID=A0A841D318_PLAVE|nr:DUF1707 domain-containing protein [Planomonospora venezuelensis]MBB5963879.1 hypothetical protein [Planomonospora venezuelensis]GIN03709.1 hypothetical protein Pve01_53670 [Planomonospora venezuelensis]